MNQGGVVVCRFCGRESRVAAPAPLHQPFPHGPQPGPTPKTKGSTVALAIGLSVAAFIGVVVLSVGLRWLVMYNASSSVREVEKRATAQLDTQDPQSWREEQPPLLRSDAGAPNIAGIARWFDGQGGLVLLSGVTGKVLWRVPGSESLDLYSDGADVLLAFDPAKKVTRYDAKTGAVKWSITVADHVHEITFGTGCAAVLFGSKPTGIDTATGNVKSCAPSRAPVFGRFKNETHDVELDRGDLHILGGLQLDDKPVNAAPPRFAVSASRAGKPVWRSVPTSLEPVWTHDGFHRSIVLTPAGVFVFGRSSADHTARWLLLDTASGRVLYEMKSSAKVDDRVSITAAGSLVYVAHDRRLEVLRAATGAVAWAIGN